MIVFTETKHRLDGRTESFEVTLLAAAPTMVTVRYDFSGERYARAGGFTIPPGSYTTGFFWRERSYNLYHITHADGTPIADRFDVVESVRIRRDRVEFTDLLLDLWVSALGEAHFEDEDEVREYHERGLIGDERLRRIERTGSYLARNHRRIVVAALAELSGRRR